MKISRVIIYNDSQTPEINLGKIVQWIKKEFPIQVEIRGSFFQKMNIDNLQRIESARIFDLKKPFCKQSSKDRVSKTVSRGRHDDDDALYDGFEIFKVMESAIPSRERSSDVLSIIFTDKMTCTFDESDFRYHARALIGSNPSIISIPGMIEAPAKPKGYYLELMTGSSIDKVKKRYDGQFLEYHDSRLSRISEGYVLQSIVYFETGDPFCPDRRCRLFNAHWQKDLLFAQIENRMFCTRHEKIINAMKSPKQQKLKSTIYPISKQHDDMQEFREESNS